MDTVFIEATDARKFNWGKFMVARFTEEEWGRREQMEGSYSYLLRGRGWTKLNVVVLDLETGEGAIFMPGGHASSDLNGKHQIWVCPMFEPFLGWLYAQDLSDLSKLPAVVDLGNVPVALYGYRRTRGEG